MKKNILLLIFSLFIILSCTNNKNRSKNHVREINITQEGNIKEDSKLSELIENFRFVSLEKKENSLIGKINKIRVFDNKIFVLDAMSSKSLFVFSNTGSFLYKVGKAGNGPGEFLLPMDFTIDKKNKEVIILDAERKMLHFYSLSGIFKNSKKLDFFADGLAYDNSQGRIIFKGAGRADNLILSDKNGIKKSSFFSYEKRVEAVNPGNPIRIFNDSTVHFRLYARDTIYKINSESVSPSRFIKFKNEDKSFFKSTKGTLKDLDKINNILKDYIETEQHVWLSYFTKKPKNSYYTLFINKKNNHQVYYERSHFINDLYYDNYFLNIATTVGDEYVFIVTPYRLLKIMNNAQTKSIANQKTVALVNGLNETSNPVLMFATFKDF